MVLYNAPDPTFTSTRTLTSTATHTPSNTLTITGTTTVTSLVPINLPSNLQDGLVAYYPFNGNANDESGNTHDGIVMGATLTSDRFGRVNRAYHFDYYQNTYIRITATVDLKPSYVSLSAWARRSRNGAWGWQEVVSATEIRNRYVMGWLDDAIIGCITWDWPTKYCCLQAAPSADLYWHHIVLTYKEGEQNLYVDGILKATHVMYGPIMGYNSNWIGIGADDDAQTGVRGNSGIFSGEITEIRIYNRSLTLDEIIVLSGTTNTYVAVNTIGSYNDCKAPTNSNTQTSSNTDTSTATETLTPTPTTSGSTITSSATNTPIIFPIPIVEKQGKQDESNNKLGIGLGVGLGVGALGIAATAAGIFYCYKNRHKYTVKPEQLPSINSMPRLSIPSVNSRPRPPSLLVQSV